MKVDHEASRLANKPTPKKVFKYQVDQHAIIKVSMPYGAKPLHFAMQNNRLCLWALVTPENTPHEYEFRMAGTGHPVDDCGELINTLFLREGTFVFHFFCMP